ncbi:MAG: fructose-bisphosphate aldolase class I [Anaerolineaceae bacterium]|nr:fructose-bisphosphate aldolase class I [Anaerolineaceae bacterium]
MTERASIVTTAQTLVAPGKGILAADESDSTIKKRFSAINLESTFELRRAYRDMLFTTPGIEQYISGVILFDETIHQTTIDGTPFPKLLEQRGIIPGIKVDTGAKELAGFPGEKVTEGLDGLRERLAAYRALGARFAKWRAVITIGADLPTRTCLEANAEMLARYAALCQEAGLAPIVEPEVLMEGDHSMQRCEEVTTQALEMVFNRLAAHRVLFEGMLLKPNMVVPGSASGQTATPQQIAAATVRTLRRTVPPAVPGVVFLSGGQGPEEATENLNAINTTGKQPWQLSFSYGRALQDLSMKSWSGNPKNGETAQRLFFRRAALNSAATFGSYSNQME